MPDLKLSGLPVDASPSGLDYVETLDVSDGSNKRVLVSSLLALGGGGGGSIASTSSVLKGNGSGGAVAATAGTDYLSPTGSGAGLSGVLLAANNLSDVTAATARANLGLGTAATTAATAYATAAQGGKADSAVQPADLAAFTGSASVVTLGTVAAGTWNATAIGVAKLGSGTPSAGKYLDGGGTWTTLPAGGSIASTSSLLKGDGAGAAVAATAGTDYPGLATANTFTAAQAISPTASTGTPAAGFTVTSPAHTALATGTEYSSVVLNMASTKTFAGSTTIALQRTTRIMAETLAAASATTITAAATLSISGPPVAGTNVTITNPYALEITGNMRSRWVLDGSYAWSMTYAGSTLTLGNSNSGATFTLGNFNAFVCSDGGVPHLYADKSGARLSVLPGSAIGWSSSSGNAAAAMDTGLARASAAVVRVTDGSTGAGDLAARALFVSKNAAPADAELAAGQLALWFDSTNGAARLMLKGKSANGTVVTGNVTLT